MAVMYFLFEVDDVCPIQSKVRSTWIDSQCFVSRDNYVFPLAM